MWIPCQIDYEFMKNRCEVIYVEDELELSIDRQRKYRYLQNKKMELENKCLGLEHEIEQAEKERNFTIYKTYLFDELYKEFMDGDDK